VKSLFYVRKSLQIKALDYCKTLNYEKIRLVLGDNNKPETEQFIVVSKVNAGELFGNLSDVDLEDSITYRINRAAFSQIASYRKIYNHNRLE